VQTEIVSLPAEPLPYAALSDRLARTLALTPDAVLLAESFSGPIAMMLAAAHPVAALILCNSFVRPPRPSLLRMLATPALFRGNVPLWVVRRYFVGPDASAELVDQVREAIGTVDPALLAFRLANVLTTDASAWLTRCGMPMLYLRGTRDRLIPESSVEQIAARSPIRVVRIPGPHLLIQACPTQAWAAVNPFLRSRPQPNRALQPTQTVPLLLRVDRYTVHKQILCSDLEPNVALQPTCGAKLRRVGGVASAPHAAELWR
jgi:pimeloyl-[acyl-carrier protein] methyl ester esterase